MSIRAGLALAFLVLFLAECVPALPGAPPQSPPSDPGEPIADALKTALRDVFGAQRSAP